MADWIWDDVRNRSTLPSLVLKRSTKHDASLSDHVRSAVDQLAASDARRILLVCHSIGGVIGVEISKQMASNIAGVLYVAAVIPNPGRSYVQSLPFLQRIITSCITSVAGTKPPSRVITKTLCEGIGAPTADKVAATFAPETKSLFFDRTAKDPFPALPRRYILTSDDKNMSIKLQQMMASRIGAETMSIGSGHLPMLSRANAVSDQIDGFAHDLE